MCHAIDTECDLSTETAQSVCYSECSHDDAEALRVGGDGLWLFLHFKWLTHNHALFEHHALVSRQNTCICL